MMCFKPPFVTCLTRYTLVVCCVLTPVPILMAEPPAPKSFPKKDASKNTDSGAAQTEEVLTPADVSLTAEEYLQAGMPADDRDWSGSDMTRANQVLTKISKTNFGHLPRYHSKRSGDVFARITADGNLEMFRNRSIPLQQRFPEALSYIQSNGQIFKLYMNGFHQNATGGSELVELSGATLRTTLVMLQLVDEFVPTLDKNDPSYATRMQGLERMRGGLANIVAGGLQTLTESDAYSTSELKRLIGYLRATLPGILPALPPKSRSETLIRLKSFLKDPKMQHLQPELTGLASSVEESSKSE